MSGATIEVVSLLQAARRLDVDIMDVLALGAADQLRIGMKDGAVRVTVDSIEAYERRRAVER